ncbi:hypothetical protein IB268_26340 [Achromobacter sp. ACM01]|uniref:hypothetical protein n=1 Tax=Achromobacter sp. ACM01 TaxID=2769298 RepID=UPI001786AB12|nr:hypothetical protein [Achromobacter sp. ACM01]MBD9476458.1 hypothetical protein [Achromobacter sp. ACM01]
MTTTLPAGWKLVPIEPTPKMVDATWNDPIDRDGGIESQNTRNRRIYAAMLAAAPTPPATTQDDTLARTGNTADHQEGWFAGVDHGRAEARASTQDDAKDERSATYGMTLGERIAHVGGRTNAQSYTEFGSPMAVNALIQHVLRDLDWTRQDDDGAYQARYRLPGGQWSSWGHVVCGVKGHEQELRYLPGARSPAAPAAGDARGAAVGAAIERACAELPFGYSIEMFVEAGYGGARLVDPEDGEIDLDQDERDLAKEINAGIDAAIAAQQGKGDGA